MEAVNLVKQGWSIRKAAKHFGFSHCAVRLWLKKKSMRGRQQKWVIPTLSSRPKSHPKALSKEKVEAIVVQRKKRNRCAEVVWQELLKQGVSVSLSSVKRTLKRQGLIKKRNPEKRWHLFEPRPQAILPGDLVQIDTIHFLVGKKIFYVYTLIDLASRWAYATVSMRINTHRSLQFVKEAITLAPFSFKMIQSDHGSEFSTWFSENLKKQLDVAHRHSRVRKKNDNAHIERFNRTLEDECLYKVSCHQKSYQQAIEAYLPYYNNERLHLGINFLTPLEWLQAIG
jgi:transposase InsO family protein